MIDLYETRNSEQMLQIHINDYPFCSHTSNTRRKKVYAAMLAKAMELQYLSLHAFLVSHYQVQTKTWEQVANILGVSAGSVQRATEALHIWRKIKRNRQRNWML